MSKFKLFGLVWDFSVLFEMLWVLWGCLCFLWIFAVAESPWWANVIWVINLIIFMATAESVTNKDNSNG